METLIGVIILGLFINFLSNRIEANLPKISGFLVNVAAFLVPKSDKERLREEWQAHVADIPGLSKLWQALQLPYVAAVSEIEKLTSKWVRGVLTVVFFLIPPYAYKIKIFTALTTGFFLRHAYPAYKLLKLEKIDRARWFPRYCAKTSLVVAADAMTGIYGILSDPTFKIPDLDIREIKQKGDVLLSKMDVILCKKYGVDTIDLPEEG